MTQEASRIVDLEDLAPGVTLFEVSAPKIAHAHLPGQFVMVRPRAGDDLIPLAVAWTDPAAGTLSLVAPALGATAGEMCRSFRKGDTFAQVAGPVGRPTRIEIPGFPPGAKGTVVFVAGGVGAAPVVPIARAFHRAGHRVIVLAGAWSADRLILDEWLGAFSAEIHHSTRDGSFGRKGAVADLLRAWLLDEMDRTGARPADLVFAVGAPAMMRACCEVTHPLGIPTLVGMNTLLVDGTGTCGTCDIQVDGNVRNVCVDGPEFDGHKIDWDDVIAKMASCREDAARRGDHPDGPGPVSSRIPGCGRGECPIFVDACGEVEAAATVVTVR